MRPVTMQGIMMELLGQSSLASTAAPGSFGSSTSSPSGSDLMTAIAQAQSDAAAWQQQVSTAVPPTMPPTPSTTAPGTTGTTTTTAPGAGANVPNPNNPGYYMDGTPDLVDPTVPNAQGQMVPNPNYQGGAGAAGAPSGGGGGGGGGGGDDGGGGGDDGGGDDFSDVSDAGDQGGGDFGQTADMSDQGDASLPPEMQSAQLPDQGDLMSTMPDMPDGSSFNDDDGGDTGNVDPNDPYATIMGELTGHRNKRKRALVGQTTAPATTAPSAPFLSMPLWTGSPVRVWQAMIGAGVAVALSTVLLVATRKRK